MRSHALVFRIDHNEDDGALWECGSLAAPAQAWSAAIARETSKGLWAPASPTFRFSATSTGRPQARHFHSAPRGCGDRAAHAVTASAEDRRRDRLLAEDDSRRDRLRPHRSELQIASNSRRASSSEMSADQPYAAATAASRASCASASHCGRAL